MSSNRIGFRAFKNRVRDSAVSVIIDSNVLIAYFDENHTQYEEVRDFLDELDEIADVTFFTTVTTKSEFLEYQRRRLLTDGLMALNHQFKEEVPINSFARAKISSIEGRRNARENLEDRRSAEDPQHDFDARVIYLSDSEIKEVKKAFLARDITDETGWLKICETFLGKKLLEQESLLDSFCEYLSPHREKMKHLFTELNIDWKKATEISGRTGMGFSDSLILNMLLHTHIEYILTLDYDLIYASAISAKKKSVVLPENRISRFKKVLKGV